MKRIGQFLFRMWVKVTGFLPFFILLRLKKYHLDKYDKEKLLKGNAIIISNHNSTADFFILLMAFWYRYVHVLIGEQLYRKKSWGNMLDLLGALPVYRTRHDLSFMGEAISILKKGGVVGIFPEGRFNHGGQLNNFEPSAIYLALKSGAPILPIYIENNAGTSKRSRVLVGQKIYVSELLTSNNPSKGEVLDVASKLQAKVLELKKQLHLYKTYHLYETFRFRWFLLDLIKVAFFPLNWFVFPTKFHYIDGASKKERRIKGRAILLSNHKSFYDPPLLMVHYISRRIHSVVASDVSDKKPWFFNAVGCIVYHRYEDKGDAKCFLSIINYLRSNAVVNIYPEGHIDKTDKLDKFQDGAAYFSFMSEAPVYFYYMRQENKPFHLNHVYILPHINPLDYFSSVELKKKENIPLFTKIIEDKFHYLEHIAEEDLKNRKKQKKQK